VEPVSHLNDAINRMDQPVTGCACWRRRDALRRGDLPGGGMSGFELVLDVQARLGESPVWSVDEQALSFVDIKGRIIHRFRPETGNHRLMPVEEDVGCVGLVRGGGFIAGMRSGLWRLDEDGRPLVKLADNPETTPRAASMTAAAIRGAVPGRHHRRAQGGRERAPLSLRPTRAWR
jgi:hypothetical protein